MFLKTKQPEDDGGFDKVLSLDEYKKMSGVEFSQRMAKLSKELFKDLDKEEADKGSESPTPKGSHHSAAEYKITEDKTMTFGSHGGVAFCDNDGSVCATMFGRGRVKTDDGQIITVIGMRVLVNGEEAFVPMPMVDVMLTRIRNAMQGLDDSETFKEEW